MTLLFTPQGFFGCREKYTGEVKTFARRRGIASGYNQNIFRGDPVKLLTDGTFALAVGGDNASAIFVGWNPEDPNRYGELYWRANDTYVKPPDFFFSPIGEAYVYSIQGEGPIQSTAIGDSCDWVIGTGNPRSGNSGAFLASNSLVGAGGTAGVKILNLRRDTENAFGDLFTIVEVIINEYNTGLIPGNAI